jgi:hypothetical protein
MNNVQEIMEDLDIRFSKSRIEMNASEGAQNERLTITGLCPNHNSSSTPYCKKQRQNILV